MTAKSRSQLLALFTNGQVADQTDFQDLFDSFINVVDTTAQSINSDLTVGGNLTATGNISGNFGTISITNATVTNLVSTSATLTNAQITSASITRMTVSTASAVLLRANTIITDNIILGGGGVGSVNVSAYDGGATASAAVSLKTEWTIPTNSNSFFQVPSLTNGATGVIMNTRTGQNATLRTNGGNNIVNLSGGYVSAFVVSANTICRYVVASVGADVRACITEYTNSRFGP